MLVAELSAEAATSPLSAVSVAGSSAAAQVSSAPDASTALQANVPNGGPPRAAERAPDDLQPSGDIVDEPASSPQETVQALPRGHGEPAASWGPSQTAATLRDLGGEPAAAEPSADDGPAAMDAVGGSAGVPAASLSEPTPAPSTAVVMLSRLSALAAAGEPGAANVHAYAEGSAASDLAGHCDTSIPPAEAELIDGAAMNEDAEQSAIAADATFKQQEELRAGPPEHRSLSEVPQPAVVPVATGPALPVGVHVEPSGDAIAPLEAVPLREPVIA